MLVSPPAQLESPTVTSNAVDPGYDMFDHLVAKDMSVGGDVHERYVYDGDNLLMVLDPSGNVLQRELDGGAVDQVLASESPDATQSDPTQGVRWLLTDNQGTVSDLAAYNAVLYQTNINDHLVYDAFGNISSQTQPTARPPFTYTGQWFDAVTGLNRKGQTGTTHFVLQSA